MTTENNQLRLMKYRKTFEEVLTNFDDKVIVRELLSQLVPAAVKKEIVDQYNRHVDIYNKNLRAH